MIRLRCYWQDVIILSFLLLASVPLRFYQLGQIPPGLNPDEATHGLDALEVLKGQFTIYSPNEGSTGMLWRYLLAVDFAFFGPSIISLRGLAAAVGVASIGVAYVALREIFRAGGLSQARWVAGTAALWQAVSMWHLWHSRVAFSAILLVVLQDAAFWLMWRAVRRGRQAYFFAFGLVLGLQVYNYLPAKLVPAVPVVFLGLNRLLAGRRALWVKFRRRWLLAAGVALLVGAPFLVFVLFNFQMLQERASLPLTGEALSLGQIGLVALGNLAAFGLWPVNWWPARWSHLYLGPWQTLFFVVGFLGALWHSLGRSSSEEKTKRSAFLFLPIWWVVMLLPGVIASDGAIPQIRRSIGAMTPTYALAALGLATLVASVAWGLRRLLQPGRLKLAQGSMVAGLGLLIAFSTYRHTWPTYLAAHTGREAELSYHVYELELARQMAAESGPETVYLLPLDSAAGAINPLLDTITFVYRGQAGYDFLPDDEVILPQRLAELTAGRSQVRLLSWHVTKHTGADPKQVAHYYLEKAGHLVDRTPGEYYDLTTYNLDPASTFQAASLTPATLVFDQKIKLVALAYGGAGGVPAGDFIWVELTWQKIGPTGDYHVLLLLEDETGHLAGQIDKPLLANRTHQPTGDWPEGAQERDYYLLPVDPATTPGRYQLKVVVYDVETGRRLLPQAPGVGPDLAWSIGTVSVLPATTPPDPASIPVAQSVGAEAAPGLHLVGLDLPWTKAGPVLPGDSGTVALVWAGHNGLSEELTVQVVLQQEPESWPLSQPVPVGGSFPTGQWRPGEVVRQFVDVRLPRSLAGGTYSYGLILLDEAGNPSGELSLGPGTLVVDSRVPEFTLPPLERPVRVAFGEVAELAAYDLDLSQVATGGPARLTLYWQARAETDLSYKVFVHLLDAGGAIVSQVDRLPHVDGQPLPTTAWFPGEVIQDELEIPVGPELAGVTHLAVGLYDAVTGERLPVDGGPVDHVLLVVP